MQLARPCSTDQSGSGGTKLRRLQTGRIQAYLFGALGGAIAVVIIQYVIR